MEALTETPPPPPDLCPDCGHLWHGLPCPTPGRLRVVDGKWKQDTCGCTGAWGGAAA